MRPLILAVCLTSLATPALASEFVPADATGPLTAFRGKYWSAPLIACAGYYRFDERRLASLDKPTEAANAASRQWKSRAAVQAGLEDNIDVDEALGMIEPEIDFAASGAPPADWKKACDEIKARYEAQL
jgi:hypothetical protein